jgi:predicted outer membrane repeat protein
MRGFTSFRRMAITCITALLVFGFFFSEISQAQIVVTALNDETVVGDTDGLISLREAVIMANSNGDGNDDITFDPSLPFPGTITLTVPTATTNGGNIGIGTNMTIIGPGPDMLTITANNVNNYRVFTMGGGNGVTCFTVEMSGLRLENNVITNFGGGGAISTGLNLTLDNMEFINNTSRFGGAIAAGDTSSGDCNLVIRNSKFMDNNVTIDAGLPSSGRGGAIWVASTYSVNISGTEFIDNSTPATSGRDGGAIFLQSRGPSEISDSLFVNNRGWDGGAINVDLNFANTQSTFKVLNTEFRDNQGRNGGAIEVAAFSTSLELEIRDSKFLNNSASFIGGALYMSDISQTDILNSEFRDNSAGRGGGGLYANQMPINIDNNLFFRNSGSRVGGGVLIQTEGEIAEVTNSTFVENKAEPESSAGGGGIAVFAQSIVNIRGSFFLNNTAVNKGGAVWNNPGLPDRGIQVLSDTVFDGNSAALGGAISNDSPGGGGDINLISGVTFKNNTTTGNGGAINNGSRIHNILNSTFSANMADDRGGAIFNASAAETYVNFSTFVDNMAAGVGGGAFFDDSAMSIHAKNSILQSNTPDNCAGNIIPPTIDEGGNYTDDTTCGYTGDAAFIILGPLVFGGRTTETFSLLNGDPIGGAVDCMAETLAGPVAVNSDQRGFPRPFDTLCDSGSVEVGGANVKITKVTVPGGGTGFSFTSTGFDGLVDCDITPVFMLDHNQMAACNVIDGDYTVTETIPVGQVLTIVCTELPATNMVDDLAGALSFTIAEDNDSADCLFINSLASTVVRTANEPAGTNCEFGGTKIESGPDNNQNGVLDDAEVIPLDTVFVCNGAPGEEGPQGPLGPSGLNSLVNITQIPGPDDCEFGGIRVDSGLDDDANGILDDPEIDNTSFVCNGAPGDDTLIDVTPVAPGASCAFGGFLVETGVDDNLNGTLDPDEVDSSNFICNGEPGADGEDGTGSLIIVEVELPGANCGFGGIMVKTGQDDNDNGVLDPGEIDSVSLICNGEPGLDTLEDINIEPAGENCPEGGLRFDSGLDLNENGILDPDEITQTSFVCNGEDGENGTNSSCSVAGPGADGGDMAELLMIVLIPFVITLGRRVRREKKT